MVTNKFMRGLQEADNITLTTNGAITYKSTLSGLMDLFALGGAYRARSDEDCIVLFKKAFDENPSYALKCLFYLRDCRGGQGERRFFRTVYKWLINYNFDAAKRNFLHIPEFGRYDDMIYIAYKTNLWNDCISFIKDQLRLDMQDYVKGENYGISLMAKWLPSENTSSKNTREVAGAIRKALQVTSKEYRQTLSMLRERINVLERLMSANKWDEIDFSKIPSKAGFKYRNAFARHDIERQKSEKNVVSYEDFMADKETKVNAKTLYPYEIVDAAINLTYYSLYFWGYKNNKIVDPTERNAVNKYWENFLETIPELVGRDFLCVCDTSSSMLSGGIKGGTPMDVAISLSMVAAKKAKGPFANSYISFSRRPQLITIEGADFVDEVKRIYETNICENTNIEATFDLLLNTAIRNHCRQEDLPQSLVIISDQQFDSAVGYYYSEGNGISSLLESIALKWKNHGYIMPDLIFWNVNAALDTIPMKLKNGVTFVSGLSPSLFESFLSGKTAEDFVFDVLNKERYAVIQ